MYSAAILVDLVLFVFFLAFFLHFFLSLWCPHSTSLLRLLSFPYTSLCRVNVSRFDTFPHDVKSSSSSSSRATNIFLSSKLLYCLDPIQTSLYCLDHIQTSFYCLDLCHFILSDLHFSSCMFFSVSITSGSPLAGGRFQCLLLYLHLCRVPFSCSFQFSTCNLSGFLVLLSRDVHVYLWMSLC